MVMRESLSGPNLSRNAGLVIAAFPVLTFALQVILRRIAELGCFAPNLGACLALAAVVIAIFLAYSVSRNRRATVITIVLFLSAIAALASVGFARMPDNGFDAQSYHLPSVLRLLDGWRPMIEATDLTLSNSYPSAIWTILGGFDAIFGFESGRAINLILIIAAGGAVWALFEQVGASPLQTAVISLTIIANPIAVSQFFTSLADGTLYELALILMCSLIIMIEDRSLICVLLGGASLILVSNVKSTGLFFAFIALAIAAGLLAFHYRSLRAVVLPERRRQIMMLAFSGLIAVGFVGWRPYVTNLLEHESIVYPPPAELGYGPGDPNQIPSNLVDAGRIHKLLALFFAQTDVDRGPIVFKFPASFEQHELRMGSATPSGGFGPFFGGATLLSVAALAFATARRSVSSAQHTFTEALAGLAVYGAVTTVLFPEPWWARFVPLAWLIPIGVAFIAYAAKPSWLVRACVCFVIGLGLMNAGIAAFSAEQDAASFALDIRQKLKRMIREPGPIYLSRGTLWNARVNGRHAAEDVWRQRLLEKGKDQVIVVSREDCQKLDFLTVDVERCAPP
jgi:hypothetical protein